jgi:hypothetical protein
LAGSGAVSSTVALAPSTDVTRPTGLRSAEGWAEDDCVCNEYMGGK